MTAYATLGSNHIGIQPVLPRPRLTSRNLGFIPTVPIQNVKEEWMSAEGLHALLGGVSNNSRPTAWLHQGRGCPLMLKTTLHYCVTGLSVSARGRFVFFVEDVSYELGGRLVSLGSEFGQRGRCPRLIRCLLNSGTVTPPPCPF
jgi:hypothetical protein